MNSNPARTTLTVLTFLGALAILLALGAAAVAAFGWLISEGFMTLFPLDYAEISQPDGAM